MSATNRLTRYGGKRLTRRLRRSIPIIGTALAVATVVSTIRRKGVISGSLDTGLDAVPFVGTLKNVVEIVRGRDFFPDRYPRDRYTAAANARPRDWRQPVAR